MLRDVQCRIFVVLNAFIALVPMLCSAISADMQYLLDRHNLFRCMHGVPALTWDATVAESAQKWANAATSFGHANSSSQYYSYGNACGCGENAAGMGSPDPKGAADMWYSEYTGYKQWDLNHFTAMIWKDVSYLGCGVRVAGPAWPRYAFVICRYKQKTGMGPNVGGEASKQVSLTIVKSMNACEGVVKASDPTLNGQSDSNDDDGLSTTALIIIIAGAVLALLCLLLVVVGLMRRGKRQQDAPLKQPVEDPPEHTEVTPEVFTEVRQTADAEKEEPPLAKEEPPLVKATHVAMSMTVDGVDYNSLRADQAAHTAFTSTVKQHIADEASVLPEDVDVKLSSGSVKIDTKIKNSGGTLESVQSKLSDSSTLSSNLVDRVKKLPGIERHAKGDIGISNFSAPVLQVKEDEDLEDPKGNLDSMVVQPATPLEAPKTPQIIEPQTPLPDMEADRRALSEDEAIYKLHENEKPMTLPTLDSARDKGMCSCVCDSS